MVSSPFQQHLCRSLALGPLSPVRAAGGRAASGSHTWCQITSLQFHRKLRIWVKIFSFRINWLSYRVVIAEVICMTLFPFSQAKLLSCSRQKLIKWTREIWFFFTLHKAVKKPRFATFALNVQNLSQGSRHYRGFGDHPADFPSKGNRRSLLGEEGGTDFSCCWQGCSYSKEHCPSFCIDYLYFRSRFKST